MYADIDVSALSDDETTLLASINGVWTDGITIDTSDKRNISEMAQYLGDYIKKSFDEKVAAYKWNGDIEASKALQVGRRISDDEALALEVASLEAELLSDKKGNEVNAKCS